MRDTNQTIIKFNYDKNLSNDDFVISKSNKHIFEFLDMWPKWEKNFINIIGEKLSGKTHPPDLQMTFLNLIDKILLGFYLLLHPHP